MAATKQGDIITEAYNLATTQFMAESNDMFRRWTLQNLDPYATTMTQVGWNNGMVALQDKFSNVYNDLTLNTYDLLSQAELGGFNRLPDSKLVDFDSHKAWVANYATGPYALEEKLNKVTNFDANGNYVTKTLPDGVLVQSVNHIVNTALQQTMEQGRQNGQNSILLRRADRKLGYARQATGTKTCSFCTMLISRGAVYTADSVRFQSHAKCDCMPLPAGKEYSMTKRQDKQVQEWRETWEGRETQRRRYNNAKTDLELGYKKSQLITVTPEIGDPYQKQVYTLTTLGKERNEFLKQQKSNVFEKYRYTTDKPLGDSGKQFVSVREAFEKIMENYNV